MTDEPVARQRTTTKPKPSHAIAAVFGAVVLGVLVPCALAAMQIEFPVHGDGDVDTTVTSIDRYLQNAVILSFFAGFFCGPGAVILAAVIMIWLRRKLRNEACAQSGLIRQACLMGIVAAFLNLPGYMCGGILPHDHLREIRVVTLFVVTGATCGAWIGWQAWRERDPKAGFIPRFSLRLLILLTLGWGILLALFIPRGGGDEGVREASIIRESERQRKGLLTYAESPCCGRNTRAADLLMAIEIPRRFETLASPPGLLRDPCHLVWQVNQVESLLHMSDPP